MGERGTTTNNKACLVVHFGILLRTHQREMDVFLRCSATLPLSSDFPTGLVLEKTQRLETGYINLIKLLT